MTDEIFSIEARVRVLENKVARLTRALLDAPERIDGNVCEQCLGRAMENGRCHDCGWPVGTPIDGPRYAYEVRETLRLWGPIVEAIGSATGVLDHDTIDVAIRRFDALPRHLRPLPGGAARCLGDPDEPVAQLSSTPSVVTDKETR